MLPTYFKSCMSLTLLPTPKIMKLFVSCLPKIMPVSVSATTQMPLPAAIVSMCWWWSGHCFGWKGGGKCMKSIEGMKRRRIQVWETTGCEKWGGGHDPSVRSGEEDMILLWGVRRRTWSFCEKWGGGHDPYVTSEEEDMILLWEVRQNSPSPTAVSLVSLFSLHKMTGSIPLLSWSLSEQTARVLCVCCCRNLSLSICSASLECGWRWGDEKLR